MDLELQHADSVVELGSYRVLLVRGDIALPVEGAVVCSDVSDIRVIACAKLDVAVAWLRVCR